MLVSLLVTGAFGGGAQAELSRPDSEDVEWAVAEPVFHTVPYKIRHGGTIKDVAQLYDLDAELIAAMNNLSPEDCLLKGQVVNLPAEQILEHVIEPGESIWEIALQYSVKPEVLVWENDIEDESFIRAGQTIMIPMPFSKSVFRNNPTLSRGLIDTFLQWPVIGTISSRYGWRWGRTHHGLDIAAETGKPIRAATAGVVKYSGDKGTYGKMVILEHANGLSTYYAHASELLVEAGEYVRRGQKIALVGSTGRSTGPHLHFEVRRNDEPMDPEKLLPQR